MFLVHMYNITSDDSLLVHVYGCTAFTLVPEVIAYTGTIHHTCFLHSTHAKVID